MDILKRGKAFPTRSKATVSRWLTPAFTLPPSLQNLRFWSLVVSVVNPAPLSRFLLMWRSTPRNNRANPAGRAWLFSGVGFILKYPRMRVYSFVRHIYSNVFPPREWSRGVQGRAPVAHSLYGGENRRATTQGSRAAYAVLSLLLSCGGFYGYLLSGLHDFQAGRSEAVFSWHDAS